MCSRNDPQSCKEIHGASGGATLDGDHLICMGAGQHEGKMIKVTCLNSWNGGGWTVIARALAPSRGKHFAADYDPMPPTIGGQNKKFANWNEWGRHAWRSGDSYYVSLAEFGYLTTSRGLNTVAKINRDPNNMNIHGQPHIIRSAVYSGTTYDVDSNKMTITGGCADTGANLCHASYSWLAHPPNFDGTGHATSCMQHYPESIFNYHNHAGCASDSGLFAWSHGGPRDAKPQLLGKYTGVADETLILVR